MNILPWLFFIGLVVLLILVIPPNTKSRHRNSSSYQPRTRHVRRYKSKPFTVDKRTTTGKTLSWMSGRTRRKR